MRQCTQTTQRNFQIMHRLQIPFKSVQDYLGISKFHAFIRQTSLAFYSHFKLKLNSQSRTCSWDVFCKIMTEKWCIQVTFCLLNPKLFFKKLQSQTMLEGLGCCCSAAPSRTDEYDSAASRCDISPMDE